MTIEEETKHIDFLEKYYLMNISGTIINDTFRVGSIITDGHMSCVYEGENINNKTKIVIKTLKWDNTSYNVEGIIRFQNESNIISQLDHNNIVKIYDTGCIHYEFIPSTYYIVMEYIEGESLSSLLRERGQLPIDTAINIMEQICSALEYIHMKGIIHHDLKPSNILIDTQNTIKIIDFGLSQMREYSQFTDLEEIIGTFAYMAPLKTDSDTKSFMESNDLYSVGIMLYQMLTGKLPFTGDSIMSIMQQHLAAIPKAPSIYCKSIPAIVEKIIMKLLAKDTDYRYHTACGLLHDINCYKRGRKSFMLGLADTEALLPRLRPAFSDRPPRCGYANRLSQAHNSLQGRSLL